VSINPQRFGDGIWVSRPSLLAARSFGEFSFALQMSYRLRHTFPAEAIKRPKQYAVKLSPGSSVQERGELLSPVSAPSATGLGFKPCYISKRQFFSLNRCCENALPSDTESEGTKLLTL
jgi:hypothetical protein